MLVEPGNVKRCKAYRQEAEKLRGKIRGKGGIAPALRTHCPQNHPYSGDNLYLKSNGRRECRTCHRERERAAYWRRKTSNSRKTP
jgi:hypothetical protein